jgi:serine/threonine protein kinase
MQYLQKFGIIHRDIKPGNILYDGKNWKIADFGFSLESK